MRSRQTFLQHLYVYLFDVVSFFFSLPFAAVIAAAAAVSVVVDCVVENIWKI